VIKVTQYDFYLCDYFCWITGDYIFSKVHSTYDLREFTLFIDIDNLKSYLDKHKMNEN